MKERLLGIVAAGSIGIFGGACSANSAEKAQTPAVPNVEKTIDIPTDQPISEQLIEKVYPEFRELNLKSTDFFYPDPAYTDSQVITEVINYSSNKMDRLVAEDIYREISFYANRTEPLIVDGSLIQEGAKIVVQGRNDAKLRTMIIIPENATLPLKEQPLVKFLEPSGATLNTEAGYTFSFIRLDKSRFKGLEDVNDNATISFAIEVCQQALAVELVGSDGNIIQEETIHLGQELFCNSMGIAIGAKSLGWPYDKYLDFIKNHSVANVGMFQYDENVYNSFSSLGSITKQYSN